MKVQFIESIHPLIVSYTVHNFLRFHINFLVRMSELYL